MYVKIKLTDEPSWPMCILDLSKQPAKGTAQNTERLNVNGAACSTVLAAFWLRKVQKLTYPAIGKAFQRGEEWARRQVQLMGFS